MAGGITEAYVDRAEAFLVKMGHDMAAVAHPQGADYRAGSAVALRLGMPWDGAVCDLIVEVLAYKHSGGKVGDVPGWSR